MGPGLSSPLLHCSITPCPDAPVPPAGPEGAFWKIMNNIGHLPLSETARRVGKTKARRGRPRKSSANGNVVREPAAVGTLTRTKSLLLAALRVWELKHRISD
jgi:hypothetical protein